MLIRRAQPGDEGAVAGVHVRSWQAAYRGLLPDAYLDGLEPADRARRYTFAQGQPGVPVTRVAVERGAICGFVTTGACRDSDAQPGGEVYALYVDPDWWDRSVGRALMQAAREGLADQGFDRAVLWVLAGNERAERFYGIDGWVPDGGRRIQSVHGIELDEIRYRSSVLRRPEGS